MRLQKHMTIQISKCRNQLWAEKIAIALDFVSKLDFNRLLLNK